MRKITIAYWIFTVLLAGLMGVGAIPDIMSVPQAVDMVCKHLGYPPYFVPFIGVAKLLGCIAILVPGFPRLKEWAYAGLFFDLTGAIYSSIAVGDPASAWAFTLVLGYGLLFGSYYFYHRRLKAKTAGITAAPQFS